MDESEARKMIVGAVQMSAAMGDIERNARKALTYIEEAGKQGIRALVFPELFLTEFFVQNLDKRFFRYAVFQDSELILRFREAARDNHVLLLLPFFEKDICGVHYNSVAVIDDDGKLKGVYHKNHIPFTKSFEKYYFTPGGGFPCFDTGLGRIGVLVCYDRRFPESWRSLLMQGARMVFVPISSWSFEGQSEKSFWEAELRTRALENLVYVVAANRVGKEGEYEFIGRSMIVDPLGEIIGEMDGISEGLLKAEIDLSSVDQARIDWPLLRDRRPEIYVM
jgi:predicted amidohydrolase